MSSNDGLDEETLYSISRRQAIMGIAGAGATALAGCSGGGGNSNGSKKSNSDGGSSSGSSGSSGDSGKPKDSTFDTYTWLVPANAQYNPFVAKNWDDKIAQAIFDPLAEYNNKTGKYKGYIAKEWSIDGNTMTMKLRNDYTWHNGDQVTASDVVTQFTINKAFGDPIWTSMNSIKAKDKFTVQADIKKVNPDVFWAQMFPQGRLVHSPKSRFGKWAKKLEDDSNNALQKFTQFTPKDPIGNGPFKHVQSDNQHHMTEWYDDYPLAKKPNFTKWRLTTEQTNQAKWAAIKGGECDSLDTVTPPEVFNSMPDYVHQLKMPTYGGSGLMFNMDHEHLKSAAVRRAIAYMIPREPIGATIYAPVNSNPKYLTGLPNATNNRLLGDSLNKFEQYQVNEDKATKTLQNAGYSKSGGMWTKDGSKLSFSISVDAGYTSEVTGYKALAGKLSKFGMDVGVNSVSDSAFWGSTWPNSDFDAAQSFWGARNPYQAFRTYFAGGQGSTAAAMNTPASFKVPKEVGNPDSSMQTAKVADLLDNVKTAQGDQALKQATKELAWVFNWTLPCIPIAQKKAQILITRDDWDMPPADSKQMLQGQYDVIFMLTRTGDLQAKTN